MNADEPVRSSEARAAAELALVRVVHHYGEKPGFVLLGGLVPPLLCSQSGFRHAGTTDVDVQVDLEIAGGATAASNPWGLPPSSRGQQPRSPAHMFHTCPGHHPRWATRAESGLPALPAPSFVIGLECAGLPGGQTSTKWTQALVGALELAGR